MKLHLRNLILIIFFFFGLFLYNNNRVLAVETNPYGITIDGNFDDWVGKPMTDIFFSYNNGNVTKRGSFLSDGTNLYMYIDMDPYEKGHNYRFQGSGWKLQLGDSVTSLSFTVDGGIWNLKPGEKAKISSVWSWSDNDHLFINQSIPGAVGYVSTELINGWAYHDKAEICIPLAGFIKNPDFVKQMTIYDTENMGDQKITVTGGSTGSTIIVLSGLGLASIAVYHSTRKKTRKIN